MSDKRIRSVVPSKVARDRLAEEPHVLDKIATPSGASATGEPTTDSLLIRAYIRGFADGSHGIGDPRPMQAVDDLLDDAADARSSAAEASAGAGPGLDVDVLRDALRRVYKSRYHERFAEPLAAEYAALASGAGRASEEPSE